MWAKVWPGGSFMDSTFTCWRADHQVISMAVDRRVGDEVVEVRVRRARRRRRQHRRVVVHQLPKEAERLGRREPAQPEVRQLRLERLGLVLSVSMASSSSASSSFSRLLGGQPACAAPRAGWRQTP